MVSQRRTWLLSVAIIAGLLFGGCAARIPDKATSVMLPSSQRSVDLVPVRSDTKGGPELVGIQTYDDKGALIDKVYVGGKTLIAELLDVLKNASNGVGLGVPAALGAFQTKVNNVETNNLDNKQGQGQGQFQGQHQKGVNSSRNENTSVNVNSNENKSNSFSQGGSAHAGASAFNSNENKAYGGAGGHGGSSSSEVGKINSCNGIGSC